MSLLPIRRTVNALPVRRNDANALRVEPWNDFDYMDRVFDSFFRAPFAALGRNASTARAGIADPGFELYESDGDLTAYLYAPGIPQDKFDISITGDMLTVKAERTPLFEAAENTVSHTPWTNTAATSSTFSASYTLPVEVATDQVQASYKDGVLIIKLPKSEAAKPKQIRVEVQKQ